MAGVSSNGSRPESRSRGSISGIMRGLCGATAAAIAAIWSGVVPQQPPTMLTRPSRANSPISRDIYSGVSSYCPNSLGRPALGYAHTREAADMGDRRAQVFGAERAVEADGDGIRMPHRIPEGFRQLARQEPAGLVGD